LKDTNESSPDNVGEWMGFGWLPKFYYFRGMLMPYRNKDRREFTSNMHPFMDELEAVNNDDAVKEDDPREINKVCNQYIKTSEDYKDWGNEIRTI